MQQPAHLGFASLIQGLARAGALPAALDHAKASELPVSSKGSDENMTTPLVLKIVNLGQVEASLFTQSLTRMDFLMFVPLPWLPCPRAAFCCPLSQVYELV